MQRLGIKRDPAKTAAGGLTKVDLGRHLLSTFNKPGKENVEETEDSKPTEPEHTIEQPPVSSDDEGELTELSSADFRSEPEFASPGQEEQESEQEDTRSPESSSPEPQPQPKDNNGPATDDEPISTDEDEGSAEDSDSQRPKKRVLETYDQKPKGRDIDDESDPFGGIWNPQSSKRVKTNTYGSSTAFSRTPSFVQSQATPEKSSPPTKSRTLKAQGKKKVYKKSSPYPESDSGYVISQEIHSSCPKISKSSPEFKVPTVPISSNTNSSLAASSFMGTISLDLDGDESTLSPLSSVPGSPSSEAEEPSSALCPMCKKEVDRDLLEIFLAQPKQRVREQQRFCASHQQNTAEKEWESQGYPTIDWETFDKRVQKHFSALEKLLVPDCSSYYRNILDEALKSGKSRNFRLSLSGDSLETISCGYYGTKGSGKM
jgi:hypothetical protein